MEVHHHSHTKRKNWMHYFWEFLMLFLAVFAGFLAENQREHYIEHQRAKAYAKSLLADLRVDTAEINAAILQERITDLMIDSLVIFSGTLNINKKGASLYYYMRKAGGFYGVDWRRATMNQLINSGNLRYFTSYELVNLISSYNSSVEIIKTQENGSLSNRNRAISFRDRIFKADIYLKSIDELSPDSLGKSKDLLLNSGGNWPVMNWDPELINSYANALIGSKPYRKRLIDLYYPQAMSEAIKIMTLLKKEYNL